MERRTRILLAEDEPNIRQYVQDILSPLPGIDLVCVPNGEMAIDALRAAGWDVVISDQRMGPTDGIVVLQEAARLHPHAQRAMITGFAEVGLLADAKNSAGVHRFLSKPFSPDELCEVVRSMTEHVHSDVDREKAFARARALTENT